MSGLFVREKTAKLRGFSSQNGLVWDQPRNGLAINRSSRFSFLYAKPPVIRKSKASEPSVYLGGLSQVVPAAAEAGRASEGLRRRVGLVLSIPGQPCGLRYCLTDEGVSGDTNARGSISYRRTTNCEGQNADERIFGAPSSIRIDAKQWESRRPDWKNWTSEEALRSGSGKQPWRLCRPCGTKPVRNG